MTDDPQAPRPHLDADALNALADEIFRAVHATLAPIVLRHQHQPVCSNCVSRAVVAALMKAAGLHVAHVMRGADDPMESFALVVGILNDATNRAFVELEAATAGPETLEEMTVTGKPS